MSSPQSELPEGQALTRDLPSEPNAKSSKRSPVWLAIWAVVAIGLVGNLSIVAYLFLGSVMR